MSSAEDRRPADWPELPQPPAGQDVAAGSQAAVQPIRVRRRDEPAASARVRCPDCRLRELCLPAHLDDSDLELLDGVALGRRRLHAGQAVFLEGEAFHCLYSVRSGSFKSCVTRRDGRDQVSDFLLPGDLLGLDGVACGVHASTATAMEDGEVCSIPLRTFHQAAARHPQWQDALCRHMGRALVREHRHMLLLGSAGTEGRLATFLLDLSDGLSERGWSPAEFHLRMSRAEIGSYLGLTLETVSRTLSAFQQRGWLEVRKRHIRIVAMEPLRRLRDEQGA